MTTILRMRHGPSRVLAVDSWQAPATVSEQALLDTIDGPVLDIGCGPGRLVVALAERGRVSLGIDASPLAVELSHARGGPALCRSVFDRVPGEGRWQSVLLFDGNIGIGGDPAHLLRRAAALAHSTGSVLVETDPPGAETIAVEARVETAQVTGPWFPWAVVSADRLGGFARPAGLAVSAWSRPCGRWIAHLRAA